MFYCFKCEKEHDASITPEISQSVTPLPKKAIKPPQEREAGLVDAIVKVLQLNGFEVLKVGQWRADRAGNTPGTPDLWVRPQDSTKPLWLGMEVKTATGTLSPAQKDLHKRGATVVVRSPQEALDAARKEFER
jgi:hypothetical protein